ncbi:MAG: hypothetical protein GF311_08605 [Candidatus Lokiarchaeota archaeon]|nr:hypothetical protein [Candidatus Lokiarchaeota archaeon]
MVNLDHREKPIIKLLKKSRYSSGELKRLCGQSNTQYYRGLKSLKEKDFIEKFVPENQDFKGKFKYRLSEKYKNIIDKEKKEDDIHGWISSKIKSTSLFHKINSFMESNYLNYPYEKEVYSFNELLLDTYVYHKYFNLNIDRIRRSLAYFVNTVIYLISSHPDKKYRDIRDTFKLNYLEFEDLINNFKKDQSVFEFCSKNQNKLEIYEKFYLIADDPLLKHFRQEIKTKFEKFLICWEFPENNFPDCFDFLQNFSYQILNDYFDSLKLDNYSMSIFLKKFKICLLNVIRNNILEGLRGIETRPNRQIPFKILPVKEKERLRKEILLSSEVLPTSEKKNIQHYFNNPKINKKKRFKLLKTFIIELGNIISENLINQDSYFRKKNIILKNHLLLLLRIFRNLDLKQYKEFQKNKSIIAKFPKIKLSYSILSKAIYKEIRNDEIGFDLSNNIEDLSFVIRFLIERIDHMLNKLRIEKGKNPKTITKIRELLMFAEENFTDRILHPFLRKKLDIYLENYEVISDSEIFQIINTHFDLLSNIFLTTKVIFHYIIRTSELERGRKLLKKLKLNFKEKLLTIEDYVQLLPLEFDVESFFNISLAYSKDQEIQLMIDNERFTISNQNFLDDLNKFVKFLKILGLYYKSLEDFWDAFILFLISLKFEINLINLMDPSKYLNRLKSNNIKLAHYYLIEIYSRFLIEDDFDGLNHNKIVEIIDKFSYKYEIQGYSEIDNLKDNYGNLPILIESLEKLDEYFKLKSDSQINKKVCDLFLKNISDFIDKNEGDKKFKFLEILSTKINLDPKSQNISKETEDKMKSAKEIDKLEKNIMINYKIPYQGNLIKSDIFKEEVKRGFNFFQNNYFPSVNPKEYGFYIVFKNNFTIPENLAYNEWEDLFNKFQDQPIRIIEILDIFLYSHIDKNFPKVLERISILLYNYYGLSWVLLYVDNYSNYLKWFLNRIENEDINEIPLKSENEDIIYFIDIIKNYIKALIYLKHLERSKVEIFLDKASNKIEFLEKKNNKILQMPIFEEYQEKLGSLRRKLL